MVVVTYSLLTLALIKISAVGGSQHFGDGLDGSPTRLCTSMQQAVWRLPMSTLIPLSTSIEIVNNVSNSTTHAGWTLGAGLEWRFAQQWSAKVEYLYVDLGHANNVLPISNNDHSLTENIFRIGVNYHFPGGDIHWNDWVHGIMVGMALATAAGGDHNASDSSTPVGRVGLDPHVHNPHVPCRVSLRTSWAVRGPEASARKAFAICRGPATPRTPQVHNHSAVGHCARK